MTDEQIVKAYRRQMSRHHPDKLKANGLPDSMLERAKERTQQIQAAYEVIRAARHALSGMGDRLAASSTRTGLHPRFCRPISRASAPRSKRCSPPVPI